MNPSFILNLLVLNLLSQNHEPYKDNDFTFS